MTSRILQFIFDAVNSKDFSLADIYMDEGLPLMFNTSAGLITKTDCVVARDEIIEFVLQYYNSLDVIQEIMLKKGGGDDFVLRLAGRKFRCALRNFGGNLSLSITLRLVAESIPDIKQLGLPEELLQFVESKSGLLLITGATGSGKSTTMSALLEHVNATKACKIVTIEDPIEYEYKNGFSRIIQREVGRDVSSFNQGIVSAMREAPHIIVIGEIRSQETLKSAMSAAETGHLVISTMHTINAQLSIERAIDLLGNEASSGARKTLGSLLVGIVSQHLVRDTKGGRVLAHEILTVTEKHAIMSLIAEQREHEVYTYLAENTPLMHTLNMSLARLVSDGIISMEMACLTSYRKNELELIVKNMVPAKAEKINIAINR